jgi:DNA-binding response OmpR family regulator
MKWTLVYFDDQIQNIEAFNELLTEDFNVVGCQNAIEFPFILENYHPHAILLDVHMPVLDGHALYKKISEHPLYNGCPVIFISGDQSDENKIKSYEEGGIDFLPRDISTEEIIIRLTNKIKFFIQMSTSLELGNLFIDVKTMKAAISSQNVDLTLLEFRLLSNLIRSYPVVLTRSELILKVWGSSSVKPGTVNTHLTNLKPKIENWDHTIKIREENILIQKKEKN